LTHKSFSGMVRLARKYLMSLVACFLVVLVDILRFPAFDGAGAQDDVNHLLCLK